MHEPLGIILLCHGMYKLNWAWSATSLYLVQKKLQEHTEFLYQKCVYSIRQRYTRGLTVIISSFTEGPSHVISHLFAQEKSLR